MSNFSTNNFTLPQFLWYVITGVNSIAIGVVFLLCAGAFASTEWSNGAALFALAIPAGYGMDSLRLYRVSWRQTKRSKSFFSDLLLHA